MILNLRHFSVRLGDRLVLADVNLDVSPREVLVIMGPGGAGKSTLLRTLCGLNDNHDAMNVGGRADYLGRPLDEGPRPILVEQSPQMMIATAYEYLAQSYANRSAYTRQELQVRLIAELERLGLRELASRLGEEVLNLSSAQRRLLMLARAVMKAPELLCVDEPTSGLDEADAQDVLQFLAAQREHRAVLMVTHNQRHGRTISDYTALLAGGRIQEHLPTEEFFTTAQTAEAQAFVRTGSCTVASPEARPGDLEQGYRGAFPRDKTPAEIPSQRMPLGPQHLPKPAHSESRGPYGFHWMRPGQLAGTPMPGVVRPIHDDLKALRRVEVNLLVTLTLTPLPAAILADYGIDSIHFPITDMQPPAFEDAVDLCRTIDARLKTGAVIAFHCQAGIGRTGTMLAVYEIWQGMSARVAFWTARRVHPRWIQSKAQRDFLNSFELRLESTGCHTTANPELACSLELAGEVHSTQELSTKE